jgi:S1-C subfamily serine protease
MLGNLSQARDFAESAYKQNPDELFTKVALASVLSEQLLHSRSDKLFQEAMRASRQSSLAGRTYASALQRRAQLLEAESVIKETLIKQGKDGPTLVLYSELLWDMGKFEEALDLRIEAESLFRAAGNSIMAEEVLAWMNIEAIPTLKKIEKPKSAPIEKIEAEPVIAPAPIPSAPLSPTIVEDQSPGLTGPNRRAFSPKAKPEPILIDDDLPVITGSGVILNDGYWVLTNKHVVEDLEYAVVRNGLGEVRDAEEVLMAEEDDLAIIVLDKPFSKAYSFETSEFTKAEVGSDVFVLGYPMSAIFGSFHPTITSGIVSNPFGFGEQLGEFQMTTKINPGNSGGPIFNEYGKIVGIATARLDKAGIFQDDGIIADSISIGVTSERALRFLNQPKIAKASSGKYKYTASELYKYMRSGVVLIVGQ